MSDIEKEVVEGVAVAGGLYLLYRIVKLILFLVIIYFLVHYTVGWHREICGHFAQCIIGCRITQSQCVRPVAMVERVESCLLQGRGKPSPSGFIALVISSAICKIWLETYGLRGQKP